MILDEQLRLIESLKANRHLSLRWRFAPKIEHVGVDQLVLFLDESVVIEVPAPSPTEYPERSAAQAPPALNAVERFKCSRIFRA